MLTKEQLKHLKELRRAIELRIKNGQYLTDTEFVQIWEMIRSGDGIN